MPRPGLKMLSVAAAMTLLMAIGAGCSRYTAESKRGSKVQALVVERIIPIGKLVGAAADDGSIAKHDIPGDIAPDDALTSTDGLRCMVAARDLPTGTVIRRTMFVAPSALGLAHGLTLDTGKPTGCG